MVELFSKIETYQFFRERSQNLQQKIRAFSDEKIMTTDFNEWENYLYSQFELSPLILYMENISQTMHETSIKQYNPMGGRFPYEKDYFDVEAYGITYIIPFDGSEVILQLAPSRRILMKFEADSITPPHDDVCGSLIITMQFLKRDMKDKENVQAYVASQFQREFSSYIQMIESVNGEVNSYNNSLKSLILGELKKRKEKANDYIQMSEMLNIPLSLKNGAPNTIPIPLQRVKRIPPAIPQRNPTPTEYSISEINYTNIISIIDSACSSMEATASTFCKLNEEEIRDFILATLNTHYDGQASGETFRKNGKTDIIILFENKAAYIGECKIWHGISQFSEAISQLFGYTTWRDTKTSLIIYNKTNKDFRSIRDSINNWLKSNCLKYNSSSANTWQCIFRRNDESAETIAVNISVYDLFIH